MYGYRTFEKMGQGKEMITMEDTGRRDEDLFADVMAGYDILIYNVKSKLDRFNLLVQGAPRDHKEYDMLLEAYAEDIYEMCRKFYQSERRVSG